ncbi:MAG: alpha/beta fold hydrolase [Burkholderiaceae bacterium]
MSAVAVKFWQLADGPGCPLVLSHALGLDHQMWLSTAADFNGERPVIVYDHRGHGGSPKPSEPWTMNDLVDDAAALIRELRLGPVVFAGLSMGGMVAQGLLIRHPELLSAALLAHTVARYPAPARQAWENRINTLKTQNIHDILDTVVARYLSAGFREQHAGKTAALAQQLLSMDPRQYCNSCSAIAAVDWLSQLNSIRLPVLVLAGRFDMGAPLEASEQIAGEIPGARLHVMENSAHLSPLEEPERFRQVLRLTVEAAHRSQPDTALNSHSTQ